MLLHNFYLFFKLVKVINYNGNNIIFTWINNYNHFYYVLITKATSTIMKKREWNWSEDVYLGFADNGTTSISALRSSQWMFLPILLQGKCLILVV